MKNTGDEAEDEDADNDIGKTPFTRNVCVTYEEGMTNCVELDLGCVYVEHMQ